MEQDALRWIAALRSSYDELVATVDTLDDAGLEQPSMATEWTIAQVLSHLGSGAELALASFDAARAGADPPGADSMAPVWDRWNAMSPREMATSFVTADERHVAAYEALDAAELAALRVPLPFLPAPLDAAEIVGFRLGEHALHSWDVRAALGDIAELRPVEGFGDVDGSLTIPSEAWLRLTSGRLRPGLAWADVEPIGPLSLADLRQAFPGY